MEFIIVTLIGSFLNGALDFVDGLLEGLMPITLHAESYMTTISGVSITELLFEVLFSFGVSLIILKFLKKGFDIYILWTDGDADEEPISLLTNFFKAMAVAICFPTIYGWIAQIVEELTDNLLTVIGVTSSYDWTGWVGIVSSAGMVTALFALVFMICYFMLYFQFLMRGLEILILRVGIPLACVGLLDNDKGVFKAYSQKFLQSTLTVVVQIALAKLSVGLMLNMHVFWGVASMILALKTPKFLSDFLITSSGGGNVVNNVYHSVRLVQMARNLVK